MVPICIVAGPEPERGLKDPKKVYSKPVLSLKDVGGGEGKSYQRSLSMTASSPTTVVKDNVWRTSVFHPGTSIGSVHNPNSPTLDHWLYGEETTRSK